MPNNIDISQLYEVGNRKFFAAELLANGTFGEKTYHEGLVEVKLEFSQEVTEISADDNPAFITLAGAVNGEGTVKFAVLPYSVYSKFFNVSTDRNGAVVISGKSAKPKQVAFGYYSQVGDGSESMFTLYKAAFSLPSLNSVSFDGKTIRDLTLNVKIAPYEYTDIAGKKQQVSYTILNSAANAEVWADVQDDIYIPDTEVSA
jgi:phi13 family phage major tail protein